MLGTGTLASPTHLAPRLSGQRGDHCGEPPNVGLRDDRRLDSKEKLLDWLREIEPVLADLRARGEVLDVLPRVEHHA